LINSYFSGKDKYIKVFIRDHLKDKIVKLFVDTNALFSFTSLVPSISGLSLQSCQCPLRYSMLLSAATESLKVYLQYEPCCNIAVIYIS
jgi:hypothetical protein